MDDDMIHIIVEETNRNAEKKLRDKNETEKRKWHPTTGNEIRVFWEFRYCIDYESRSQQVLMKK